VGCPCALVGVRMIYSTVGWSRPRYSGYSLKLTRVVQTVVGCDRGIEDQLADLTHLSR
jgi:hypothetical protein